MLHYHEALSHYLERTEPFVSVTQVHTVGSAPQNVGAKMLVGAEGLLWGTVGGGKIEGHCIAHAQQLLQTQTHHDYKAWNLQTDIGMTCGGVCHFYFELHTLNRWEIAVFGAGHVAQALVPLLTTLPCSVQCIDTRQDWLQRLQNHSRLQIHQVPVLAEHVATLSDNTFVVSMTMGHSHDVPVLHEVLKRKKHSPQAFPYIGVIGSAAKAGAIRRDLIKMGHTKADLEALICPVGLPLGSNVPAEIAVSISAQLIQYRDQWQRQK